MRVLGARVAGGRVGLLGVGLALLAAAFAGGYWYSLDSVAARYDTVLAENRNIVRVVSRAGRTVAARDETLRFGVSGTVSGVLVRAGEQVKAGQALVTLANPGAQLSADQALISLQLARLKLEDLVRQANSLQVTAPFAGRVSSLRVLPGDSVARGAVAAVVEDADRLVVEVRVPEHLLPGVSPGRQVQLAFPTLPGRVALGWVTEVGGSLQGAAGSATASVKVAFRNPGGVVAGTTVVVASSVEGSGLAVLGKVVAGEGQVLTARDAATVAAVHVAAGGAVNAGDVLVELENLQLAVQYEQAGLTCNTARQRCESMSLYYGPDDPMLVNVRLQYQQAKYNYDQLAERVAALRVTAPWAGAVTALNLKPGDQVAAGAVVAQLVRENGFTVTALVPAARFSALGLGQTVLIDLPEIGVSGVLGQIARKAGQGSVSGSQTVFEIAVEARHHVVPWPGTTARVNLPAAAESFEATGTARAEQQEMVKFGAAGTVLDVLVREGMDVPAGAVLITLANESLVPDPAAALSGGPLTAGSALLEEVAGPSLREELLRTRSAELTYRQKLADVQSLTLRAPYAGTISDVKVKVGDVVAAGAAGAVIVDTSGFDIVSEIGELDVGKIAVGDQMEVYFTAQPDSSVTAQVVEIGLEPRQATEGVLYPFRLRLPDSAGLRVGMTCVVQVVTDIRRDVLAVPVEAVQTRYGAKAVRVVLDRKQESSGTTSIQRTRVWKGKVEWVYVVTGVTDGVYVEIVKGLPAWSEVVVREYQRGSTASTPAGGR